MMNPLRKIFNARRFILQTKKSKHEMELILNQLIDKPNMFGYGDLYKRLSGKILGDEFSFKPKGFWGSASPFQFKGHLLVQNDSNIIFFHSEIGMIYKIFLSSFLMNIMFFIGSIFNTLVSGNVSDLVSLNYLFQLIVYPIIFTVINLSYENELKKVNNLLLEKFDAEMRELD
ncbi:MAG: hypothetical protein SFU98_02990 [Leptospiraceae bacterium]|nr:hypothetical protein [Leptospiraceae bacterium]